MTAALIVLLSLAAGGLIYAATAYLESISSIYRDTDEQ